MSEVTALTIEYSNEVPARDWYDWYDEMDDAVRRPQKEWVPDKIKKIEAPK